MTLHPCHPVGDVLASLSSQLDRGLANQIHRLSLRVPSGVQDIDEYYLKFSQIQFDHFVLVFKHSYQCPFQSDPDQFSLLWVHHQLLNIIELLDNVGVLDISIHM